MLPSIRKSATFWHLRACVKGASACGIAPIQPQGGVQALQWKTNPLRSRTDLSAEISIPDTDESVIRQLPLPEVQLGGYFSSTRLLVDNANELGEGINRGIYGSVTWPLDLPVGLDNRVWAGGTVSLDPSNNPYPTFISGGWLSQGIIPGRPLDVLALGLDNGLTLEQSIPPLPEYILVVDTKKE